MPKIRNLIDPVVILDDEEEDLFIFEKAYNKSKISNPLIKFMTAAELHKLLDSVKKGENSMPALLIVDINLGFTTGFEVVEAVRAEKFFNPLPTIMMLTSSTNLADRDKTVDVGANGFAVKPHGMQDYIDFIDSLSID